MSAVSPMSGCPTFDTDKKKQQKKNRKEPNLKLRYPTGRRSNYYYELTRRLFQLCNLYFVSMRAYFYVFCNTDVNMKYFVAEAEFIFQNGGNSNGYLNSKFDLKRTKNEQA